MQRLRYGQITGYMPRTCRTRLALLLVLAAGANAAIITLPTITTDITIIETNDGSELLDTAIVTQKTGNGPFVGGPAAIDAAKVHFTFPFAMALDARFGMGSNPVSLQDVLNVAFDTTPGFAHKDALDGGDPISYNANGGTPIGAFSSDAATDDDPPESETATLSTSITHQFSGKNSVQQTFVVNYDVISFRENGKPGGEAVPEPATLISAVVALLLFWMMRRWEPTAK